jgi:hypothetical protein
VESYSVILPRKSTLFFSASFFLSAASVSGTTLVVTPVWKRDLPNHQHFTKVWRKKRATDHSIQNLKVHAEEHTVKRAFRLMTFSWWLQSVYVCVCVCVDTHLLLSDQSNWHSCIAKCVLSHRGSSVQPGIKNFFMISQSVSLRFITLKLREHSGKRL